MKRWSVEIKIRTNNNESPIPIPMFKLIFRQQCNLYKYLYVYNIVQSPTQCNH